MRLMRLDPFDPLQHQDFDRLKQEIVKGDIQTPAFGRRERLSEHLLMVRAEFVGRTSLELLHALLIVLIRRNIDLESNASVFARLWAAEARFLCRRLDTRWLVSACDTICDTTPDPREAALALAGTLLVNTVKLYETERHASGALRPDAPYAPITERIELFDGVTCFVIGGGDMMDNVVNRLHRVCSGDSPAALIVRELLQRVQANDTVYRRFSAYAPVPSERENG